ncbi:DUF805 domain-containing protein [Massilia atriviolacea]|uniref:DUF805 domain-containing protein n=1 Tax=Massilia atriviolacea TaxID=2495579 RepID=A0A430HI98_9BURK|nr:DUF805 domain-containing protein [Massilia atriviolacea]RSZ57284.1 DUF805 domain-containing protein [Massilia atriviolacea]
MRLPVQRQPVYAPRMFALTGRIGRVRYLMYLSLLLALFMGATSLMPATGWPARLALPVVSIPLLVAALIVTRRRMNDMGRSGWWGLLYLVPLANLTFCLWPLLEAGHAGANEHGLPPAPNTWPLALGAALLPFCLLVLVPAYVKLDDNQGEPSPVPGAAR